LVGIKIARQTIPEAATLKGLTLILVGAAARAALYRPKFIVAMVTASQTYNMNLVD